MPAIRYDEDGSPYVLTSSTTLPGSAPETEPSSDIDSTVENIAAITFGVLFCFVIMIPVYKDMKNVYRVIDYSICCKIKTICCIPYTFIECLKHDCDCDFLNVNRQSPEPFCRRLCIKTSPHYNEFWETHRCCFCLRCIEHPFVDKSEDIKFNKKYNIVKAESEDTTETCSICLETLVEGADLIKLNCNHKHFHKECFREWMRNSVNNQCPLCRSINI